MPNNSIEKKIQEFKLQFQDAYTAFPETAEEFEQFLEQALKAIQEEERQNTYREIVELRSGYVYDDYSTLLYQKSNEIRSEYFDKEGEFLKKKLSQPKEEGKCNCLGLIDKELGHDGECPMRDK